MALGLPHFIAIISFMDSAEKFEHSPDGTGYHIFRQSYVDFSVPLVEKNPKSRKWDVTAPDHFTSKLDISEVPKFQGHGEFWVFHP